MGVAIDCVAVMATAPRAGSFRIDKYKSNGISVDVIRTRMEDLAIRCQKELRRKHVSEEYARYCLDQYCS